MENMFVPLDDAVSFLQNYGFLAHLLHLSDVDMFDCNKPEWREALKNFMTVLCHLQTLAKESSFYRLIYYQAWRLLERLCSWNPIDDFQAFLSSFYSQLITERCMPSSLSQLLPSRFISFIDFPPLDVATDSLWLKIFVENSGRITSLYRALAVDSSLLKNYYSTHHFIMVDKRGALSASWRHYIAILVAARHHCEYILREEGSLFLLSGGEAEWLRNTNVLPEKLKRILLLISIIVHRPWALSSQHFHGLMSGVTPWSIAELCHALLIITHYCAVTSFIQGLGLTCDDLPDLGGGCTYTPAFHRSTRTPNPLSSPTGTAAVPALPKNGRVVGGGQPRGNSPPKPTVVSGETAFLREASNSSPPPSGLAPKPVSNAFSTDTREPPTPPVSLPPPLIPTASLPPPSSTTRRNGRAVASTERPPEALPSTRASLNLETQRALIDLECKTQAEEMLCAIIDQKLTKVDITLYDEIIVKRRHVDEQALTMVMMESPPLETYFSNIFRVDSLIYEDFGTKGLCIRRNLQGYNMDEMCFSFLDCYYPIGSSHLKMDMETTLDHIFFQIRGQEVTGSDAIQNALWHYAHRLYGIQHDRFNYHLVNKFMTLGQKIFIKKMLCYPERLTCDDFMRLQFLFNVENSIKYLYIASEARRMATLSSAIHALAGSMH